MCNCNSGVLCDICLQAERVAAAAHAVQVWDQVQRRIAQTKILGMERALRVEHRPAMAKRMRIEIANLES